MMVSLRTGASRYMLSAGFMLRIPGSRSLSHVAIKENLLKDPSLLAWKGKAILSSPTFSVFNPASPETILAEVGSMDPEPAIQAAHDVLPSWRDGTTASHRSSLISQWSSLIKSNSEDLAKIMTLESGKPLAESKGEVSYAASFLDYYAAEALRSTGAGGGFMIPSPFSDASGASRGRALAVQQAVGVCALITPWNFPLAMITRKGKCLPSHRNIGFNHYCS
jgi:succinate-semialdehyde dehydrogenase/glutarate-semialdehyde dehydrogenase